MTRTMVVLPTYNECENLPLMLQALFALDVPDLSVLVVDDNSPDGTGDLADALRDTYDGLHVLHRQQKNGLGPAYLAGFKRALALGAEVIIQMDADFSHQPKYIPQLLNALKNDVDLVIGSRFAAGGSVDETWSGYRKLLSWWANRIYTPLILGLPVNDATGGFKAWRREALVGIGIDRVQSNGYVFQVEMTYVAHRMNYRIAEVPIYFPDRQRGSSKMDTSVALEAALRVWQLLWRYRALTAAERATEEASPLAP